ncbi:MAG: hypothetical protein D9V47_02980 [Clostridia bacterium]|nr:MAG: hypothetical protein D9V47_02980 [Clostridia bacterium]
MKAISGAARPGRCTKDLVRTLRPGEIAIIDHEDLDELAVQSLLQARVKAVVNARASASGRYPNLAPVALLQAGVPVLDCVGPGALYIEPGRLVELGEDGLRVDGTTVLPGKWLTRDEILARASASYANLTREFLRFMRNTLEYAEGELQVMAGRLEYEPLPVSMGGRHVLIVVRGQHYRQDLRAIAPYIREMNPVLVGVDGGADALLEYGYRPHIIIGDMDSVSDRALGCGAYLLVHAYPGGDAPGKARVERMHLPASILPAPGTSEDVAMLLAYQEGADLIVTVGSHSSFLDFMAKGRPGMASTLLVRLKIGSLLVDARGVSKLYPHRFRLDYLLEIIGAALIPLTITLLVSPPIYQLVRLFFLQLQLAAAASLR